MRPLDLTDCGKLSYVNEKLKGKRLESDVLMQQEAANTEEKFASFTEK